MNKYNETIFCNNIIKKYNILIPKKNPKSKSYSKLNNDCLKNPKKNNSHMSNICNCKKNQEKKFIKLRNFSSKIKSNLLCLKNPNKSDFVQNMLNEIIPKNIRKPYGIKRNKELNKISLKKAKFINNKIENVTYKYVKKRNISSCKIDKEKYINNFLTPFNKFMSCDFSLTNKQYNQLIKKINNLTTNNHSIYT